MKHIVHLAPNSNVALHILDNVPRVKDLVINRSRMSYDVAGTFRADIITVKNWDDSRLRGITPHEVHVHATRSRGAWAIEAWSMLYTQALPSWEVRGVEIVEHW